MICETCGIECINTDIHCSNCGKRLPESRYRPIQTITTIPETIPESISPNTPESTPEYTSVFTSKYTSKKPKRAKKVKQPKKPKIPKKIVKGNWLLRRVHIIILGIAFVIITCRVFNMFETLIIALNLIEK